MRRLVLAALALAAAPVSAQQYSPTLGAPSSAATSVTPFVASNGATSPASDATRTSHTINVVDDFGAKGDGATDDWAAIQKAEGMNSSGYCTYTQPTLVIMPPTATNKYYISQAIRRCPWVTLLVQSNATEIDFYGNASGTDYTGASNLAQWPTDGATLTGWVIAGSGLPTLAISGALNIGATSVTLATPSQTNQLVVGDLVDVETTAAYNYGGNEPVGVKMALVTALNSGVVSLDRPMDFASSSVQLRKITNGAGTAGWPAWGSGLVFYGTHHSGIIGGRWVAKSATPWYQPFDGGGGCLDCVTAPDEVIAETGVGYGNFFQDSTFSARREQTYSAAFEHAYHSSGNTTTIGDIQAVGAPASLPQPGWTIAFDEGSHDNRLAIGRVEDYNGDNSAEWVLGGAVTSGGGDALTLTVSAPAAASAAVNSGGSGYTASAVGGIATWSGSGCSTNPALGFSTNSSGVINAVTSIITPGVCTTLPSSSATTWTIGGDIGGGSGATFTLTGNASASVGYTTVSGDTISSAASNLASALASNANFQALTNFSAAANTPNGGPGTLIVSAPSGNAIPFTLTGAGANAVTAYSPTHDVVRVADASRNRIDIGSISGAAITGYPLDITGGAAANEAPGGDNDVTITESSLTWQNGDVSISGAGASRNGVHDGWFHGSTFQPKVFWLQYGAGSWNQITRVKSDSPSGYPWCDQNDMSNAFSDVFAPLTMPRTALTYGLVQPSAYCKTDRVTSNAINAFLALGGDFSAANVTSSGSEYIADQNVAGGPEPGDSFHIRAHLQVSGSAGAKTGSAAYWCTSVNWTIPSDATGMAEVDYDCAHRTANSTYCTARVISNSATSTPPSSIGSYCAFGASLGAALTINATTGSDLVFPNVVTMKPYAPTYSASTPRP